MLIEKACLFPEKVSEEWLLSKHLEVKEPTVANYRYFLDHYHLPNLGRYRIDKLDTDQIRLFLGKWRGKT